jgi:hypothetical protein
VENLVSFAYDWSTEKLSGSIDVRFPFLTVSRYGSPTDLRYDLVVEPLDDDPVMQGTKLHVGTHSC